MTHVGLTHGAAALDFFRRFSVYYALIPSGSGFFGCPNGKERKESKLPKMKTKKCAVKRMKLSKKGKVMRSQGGHAHLNNGKKRNRKNNLCGRTTVDSLKVTKTYARALQGR